ncbi:MAG TPA: hypothetical protein VHA75_09370, partial [Rugosimonospora sp.]|nr:hypothetical protein [Rugosimonospora sp.]
AYHLGADLLTPVDLGADVIGLTVGGLTVVTNLGSQPVALPPGEVLIASGPLDDARPDPGSDSDPDSDSDSGSGGLAGRVLPPDTTVWLS